MYPDPQLEFFCFSVAMQILNLRLYGARLPAFPATATPSGERIDNITDWALSRVPRPLRGEGGVGKDAIFAYVYAALHDPVWRETYAINLRREFPRIPFHADFRRWADWGERLMDAARRLRGGGALAAGADDTPDARRGPPGWRRSRS